MSRRQRQEKACTCPRCLGVPTANGQWGFDEAAVPNVHCLHCNTPIGTGPYVLITGMARFGRMEFSHPLCHEISQAKDRKNKIHGQAQAKRRTVRRNQRRRPRNPGR